MAQLSATLDRIQKAHADELREAHRNFSVTSAPCDQFNQSFSLVTHDVSMILRKNEQTKLEEVQSRIREDSDRERARSSRDLLETQRSLQKDLESSNSQILGLKQKLVRLPAEYFFYSFPPKEKVPSRRTDCIPVLVLFRLTWQRLRRSEQRWSSGSGR